MSEGQNTPAPTPRADAKIFPTSLGPGSPVVSADFARTLERENAALLAALVAQEEFERLDNEYGEMCDRAAMEGWDDDPTGSSHLASAFNRVIAAKDNAVALRAAALANLESNPRRHE